MKRACLGFSGESKNAFQALRELTLCLPGAGHQRKTYFFPFWLWLLSEASVCPTSLDPSLLHRKAFTLELAREEENFKLNTVTFYRIEALIERKKKTWDGAVLPPGDVSWLVSHLRLRGEKKAGPAHLCCKKAPCESSLVSISGHCDLETVLKLFLSFFPLLL